MYKCTNCSYKGEEVKDERFCPVCGDFVIVEKSEQHTEVKKEESKVEFDLNGDGKFDEKDKSIAGKVLRKKKKKGN